MEWPKQFKYDPVKPLIESANPAVFYFTQRDLLQRTVAAPSASLWALTVPQRIVSRQEPGGWWKALGKNEDFYLVETFKQLQTLVYQYEFDKSHPAVAFDVKGRTLKQIAGRFVFGGFQFLDEGNQGGFKLREQGIALHRGQALFEFVQQCIIGILRPAEIAGFFAAGINNFGQVGGE